MYATADEVNEVFVDNYVLKRELSPAYDLSEYASYDYENSYYYSNSECDEKFSLKSQIDSRIETKLFLEII